MTDFVKERSIKLLNKDFSGFKRDLMKFAQAHHTGSFQDFNESSPGMAVLELQAYIGDVLNFYLDMNFNEIKQQTSRQIENVDAFAKSLGYRPRGKRASNGIQTFFIEVPAISNSSGEIVPDDSYAPVQIKGTKLDGPNGTVFETTEDVDWSVSVVSDPRIVTGSQFDNASGNPTFFALRKNVEIIAGETKTFSVSINDFEQFKSIEIPDEDVLEIISCVDSDNNEWFEVDYHADEMVFETESNESDDSNVVPHVLKLRAVPRRFITDRNPTTNKTSLIFGSGDGINFDDVLIPNLADMALPLQGRTTFFSFAIDPQNFLKTRSLGLSPFNTTLTIKYRVGGGPQTNVPERSIKSIREVQLDFSSVNLDVAKKGNVIKSIETINVSKTDGGASEESISEIKANSAAFFAAQNRVVSSQDFVARIFSLPEKFGKIAKVYVRQDSVSSKAVDIHMLALNSDGHLVQASQTLKQNISTYLKKYKMLTDGINLLDANVLNLKIEFGIVVAPKLHRTEVLAKCLSVVRDLVDTSQFQIGSPIVISEIQSRIQDVFGVISVYKLNFQNAFGNEYSDVRFDVIANTANNILYCPENSIFEIKFPTKDITGESK